MKKVDVEDVLRFVGIAIIVVTLLVWLLREGR